jgi:hypothetical protein
MSAKVVRFGSLASTTLGFLVVGLASISYIGHLLSQPTEGVVTQAVVAVGILGLLSGLVLCVLLQST